MTPALDMPVKIVRRKGQKRLYVHAKDDHYLVSAPKRMASRTIEAFIRDHQSKILSLKRTADPEAMLFPADTLTLFGETGPLFIMKRKGDSLTRHDGGYLFTTLKQTPKTIRQALKKTLKTILLKRLETIHEAYRRTHPTICDRHITFKSQYMKSRFGSAIPSKQTISINLVMVHYDEALLHYIYAHEMAHFVNPDHSPAFYQTLARLSPDHKALKRQLMEVHDTYTTTNPRL